MWPLMSLRQQHDFVAVRCSPPPECRRSPCRTLRGKCPFHRQAEDAVDAFGRIAADQRESLVELVETFAVTLETRHYRGAFE